MDDINLDFKVEEIDLKLGKIKCYTNESKISVKVGDAFVIFDENKF